MPYPHVTQFETLDLRRRSMLARPAITRLKAPTRPRLRPRRVTRRPQEAECGTCA